MLHNGLQVDYNVHKGHLAFMCSRTSSSCILQYKHMTLATTMLNNISYLHTNTQNYHKYPNVLHLMS